MTLTFVKQPVLLINNNSLTLVLFVHYEIIRLLSDFLQHDKGIMCPIYS